MECFFNMNRKQENINIQLKEKMNMRLVLKKQELKMVNEELKLVSQNLIAKHREMKMAMEFAISKHFMERKMQNITESSGGTRFYNNKN